MQDTLPLPDEHRWTVDPVFKRMPKKSSKHGVEKLVKCHHLNYGGIKQLSAVGEGEVARLREIAKFCNSRNLAPRPAVQCVADTTIPPLPKHRKTPAPAAQ